MLLGGVAGNRLGAIRDAKGKSVASVFNDLGGSQKAEVRCLAVSWLAVTDTFLLDSSCSGYEGFGLHVLSRFNQDHACMIYVFSSFSTLHSYHDNI